MEVKDVLTIGGASIITVILVEAVKRALGWEKRPDLSDRFGLLLSLAIGVGTVQVFNWLAVADLRVDVATALLVGLLAGASAAGIYSGTSAALGGRKSP